MKRILLAGTAIAGVALLSQPAHADLKLDLGGYFRGYMVYADNKENTAVGTKLSKFAFLKDAEVHFTGETTTDMGLTVGTHFELKMLNNNFGGGIGVPNMDSNGQRFGNGSTVDESYAYFSGGWGRVNFGEEDGAAYLLQVATPSADSNIDGLRPTIQGFTSDVWNDKVVNGNWGNPFNLNGSGATVLGYDNADFRQTDRITYLTPKWNGFQAGVSYAPNEGAVAINGNVTGMPRVLGFDRFKDLWEASARWDGDFSGVGISAGGGYTWATPNVKNAAVGGFGSSNMQTWDAGLNFSWQGWSLGGAYLNSNTATNGPNHTYRVWDVGLGWDNGPWHAGASWWDGNWDGNAYGGRENLAAAGRLRIDRYTVGGGYTYGPGMSFRGAVAWMDVRNGGVNTNSSPVQVTLGTDINF